MERLEQFRLEAFFSAIVEHFGARSGAKPRAVVVTHLLHDRPAFLQALSRLVDILAVIPKPKSIDPRALALVESEHRILHATREEMAKPGWFATAVGPIDEKGVILIDVGGYFAAALNEIPTRASVLGIVEDTENGLQKYESMLEEPDLPIMSVARSPLKEAEDYLVGHSIVFSTEALMRSRGDILQGRPACVIGYGKVGRSIAQLLRAHGVMTSVYDSNPIRMTEALAHGFRTAESLDDALRGAGLVMCATGNYALRTRDFQRVASGAYIASVTSSDDELELDALRSHYRRSEIEEDVIRYRTDGHYFFVLNRGNAVNFLHGAVVGPAIHLVQAEILACVTKIAANSIPSGFNELHQEDRQVIARAWLAQFAEFV